MLFIECRAPLRVLARRAARRDREAGRVSDASLPIVIRESTVGEPLEEIAPEAHMILRSDRPTDAQIEDIRALLDRRIGRLR